MMLPSLPHIVYIPLVFIVGLALGWNFGSKTVRQEWERAEARRKKREEEG